MSKQGSRVRWKCRECGLSIRGWLLADGHRVLKGHEEGYDKVIACKACGKEKPYAGSARFCSTTCEKNDAKRTVKGEVRL